MVEFSHYANCDSRSLAVTMCFGLDVQGYGVLQPSITQLPIRLLNCF